MSLTKVSFSMIDGAPANPLDFGAAGDGTTNDTSALQAALSSGSKVIDGAGLTYATASQLTMVAGTTLQNITIQMADSNYVGLVYADNCVLNNVAVLGTSRVNQYPSAQIGISDDLTTGGATNVVVNAVVKYCNVNFNINGTTLSTFNIISNSASGQSGVSEGYGCLLYQNASRNTINLKAASCARHALYISSGSSENSCVVHSVGTKYSYSIQINSRRDQPVCSGNTITGSDYYSAGGVAFSQDTTANADAGGALQNNTCKDFEVYARSTTSGIYIGNTSPAFVLAINTLGANPAIGNKFINCSAVGAFTNTSLGVIHASGPNTNTTFQNCSIRGTSANTTTGAFSFSEINGYGHADNLDIDITGSGSVVGAYFANVAAGSYFTFDKPQITSSSATKYFFSGTTNDSRLGSGNTYVTTLTANSVPATSSATATVNIPAPLQNNFSAVAMVVSQSVSTSATSQVIESTVSAGVLTLLIYNGHSAPQNITVQVIMNGLPV
jgi:hypothetical protein